MTSEETLREYARGELTNGREYQKKSIEHFNREEWKQAYEMAAESFKHLSIAKMFLQNSEWVKDMLDTCHMAIASLHNAGLNGHEISNAESSPYADEIFTLVLDASIISGSNKYMREYSEKYRHYCYDAIRLAWMRMGAKYLTNDEMSPLFFEYLKSVRYYTPGYQQEWLYYYERGWFSEKCPEEYETIGKWICENIHKKEVLKMVYYVTFYEATALDYAYRNRLSDVIDIIFNDSYDRYFEMPTLYLMWKYDREKFYYYIDELKYICYKRLLYQYKYYNISSTSEFAVEMIDICNRNLQKQNKSDLTDPKNSKVKENSKYTRDD